MYPNLFHFSRKWNGSNLLNKLLILVLFFGLSFLNISFADDGNQKQDVQLNTTHSVQRDYILGVGDLVRISVYGSPDMLTEVRISSAGLITFPLIGEVSLLGLSPAEAERRLAEKLSQGDYLKNPQVNLVVVQFQSQYVSILGDVYKPGKYALDRVSTLSEVLAVAGGINSNGSDMVTLIRQEDGKPTRLVLDFRDVIANTKPESNPVMRADDIVFVGAREVSVLGRVNRPGKYTIVSGVRTVLDFLSQAGGVAQDGADTIIVITNRSGKPEKFEFDVDQLYKTGALEMNIELMSGDSIYVPRNPIFYIYGEVLRSGAFRLERNMHVAQALSVGGGLTVRGTERGLKIKRIIDGELKMIEVKPNDIVQQDDVIYVQESLF